MSEAIKRNFRLFPVLISVAVLAFALRMVSFATGYETFVTAEAIAAEGAEAQDAQDTQTQDSGDTEGDAEGAASQGPQQPLMIGMPSQEELDLYAQLKKRREELDKREIQLDMQEQLLASTEKRITDKIGELQVLEGKIKEHLGVFDEREQKQLKSVVAVYEKMKAKDAAPRFQSLDLQIQVDLVSLMKPAKVADMMAKMDPVKAQALTTELATIAQAPTIDEVRTGGQ